MLGADSASASDPDNLHPVLSDPEYSETDAQVLRMYQVYLGRYPELGGAEYWLAQYRSGMPLIEIAAHFEGSDEFRSSYPSTLTDDNFRGCPVDC